MITGCQLNNNILVEEDLAAIIQKKLTSEDSLVEYIYYDFHIPLTDEQKKIISNNIEEENWTQIYDLNLYLGNLEAEHLRINSGEYWLSIYADENIIEVQPGKRYLRVSSKTIDSFKKIFTIEINNIYISKEVMGKEYFEQIFQNTSCLIEVDSYEYGSFEMTEKESNEFRKLLVYDDWDQIFSYDNELVTLFSCREIGDEYISTIHILEHGLASFGIVRAYFRIPNNIYRDILSFLYKISEERINIIED